MGIEAQFRRFFDMHRTGPGAYQAGVELDSDGNRLNEAQGYWLRQGNMVAIASVVVLSTISLGMAFPEALLQSPIMMVLGHVTSIVFLAAAQVGTAIWYVITGSKESMKFISEALPFGSDQLRAAVCFFPLTLPMLLILLRTYRRLYVRQKNALFLLGICIACMTLLVFFLHRIQGA